MTMPSILSDRPEEISAKVGQMITDPRRARKDDPGNPEICNVFEFHRLYRPGDARAD